MAKLLDEYMEKYNEAVAGAKPGQYIVRPEIWITAKWEEDNGVNPWEPEYRARLDNVMMQDPELGEMILNGLAKMMEHAISKELGHENQG